MQKQKTASCSDTCFSSPFPQNKKQLTSDSKPKMVNLNQRIDSETATAPAPHRSHFSDRDYRERTMSHLPVQGSTCQARRGAPPPGRGPGPGRPARDSAGRPRRRPGPLPALRPGCPECTRQSQAWDSDSRDAASAARPSPGLPQTGIS